MPYALRSGLSWCEIANHILFLDLPADRYLCLNGSAAAAFLAAVQNTAMDNAETSAAEELIRLDIIHVADQPEIPPPCSISAPVRTWPATTWVISDLLAVIWSFFAAQSAIARTGLQAALANLAQRKLHATVPPGTCGTLGEVTAAVQTLGWIRSSRAQCLPRTLALAHFLAARGVAANLVIGVSLHPFRAHAWLQIDDVVVCDDVDVVRLYKPILVV